MKVPEFACGANAYLNNASVSPMPVASIRAVSEFLTKYSQIGPDSAESELDKIRNTGCIRNIRYCHKDNYRRNSYGAQYNHKSNQKNKHGPVDSNHDGYRRTGQTITILQPLVYLPFVILY